jgi:hypothetical protein
VVRLASSSERSVLLLLLLLLLLPMVSASVLQRGVLLWLLAGVLMLALPNSLSLPALVVLVRRMLPPALLQLLLLAALLRADTRGRAGQLGGA